MLEPSASDRNAPEREGRHTPGCWQILHTYPSGTGRSSVFVSYRGLQVEDQRVSPDLDFLVKEASSSSTSSLAVLFFPFVVNCGATSPKGLGVALVGRVGIGVLGVCAGNVNA